MSVNQNYGALRVVRVYSGRSHADATTDLQEKYPPGWLPEERLIHLLTRRSTTIGRALSNDLILVDPTVSREHARLVLDEHGWRVHNLTDQNVVRVNGRPVQGGSSLPVLPQDLVLIGSTLVQLVAPQREQDASELADDLSSPLLETLYPLATPNGTSPATPADEDVHGNRNGYASEKSNGQASGRTNGKSGGKVNGKENGRENGREQGRANGSVNGKSNGKGKGKVPGQWEPLIVPPIQSSAREHLSSPSEQPSHQPVPPDTSQKGPATNKEADVADVSEAVAAVSAQSSSDLLAQSWNNENVLGIGVTMQFALSQRLGSRMRWFIAGVGLAVLAVCAVLTVVLNSLIGFSAFSHEGPLSVLATLIIPLIPVIGINLLVNFIDRFEREPWFLRLAAFLWGAIIAILPTIFIELNVDTFITGLLGPGSGTMQQAILKGLNAGITEETVKGLGLLLLYIVLRDEFDNVTDGIVYGALIGAGFAMVENFIYFAQNSSKDVLFVLFVGRIVLGWLSHSTFTVCFGAALGYVRHTRIRWRQIVMPLLGYACAVGLHSVFDFVNNFVAQLLIAAPTNPTVATFSLVAIFGDYIPPFIAQVILIYILIKALGHEAAVIREFLASEVSRGVVTVDEYALLQNSFARTRQERRVLKRYGIKQWLRVRALYQTEIGLAFRKWHVDMGDKPKLGYLQPEDAYRRRIKRLRQEIVVAKDAKK